MNCLLFLSYLKNFISVFTIDYHSYIMLKCQINQFSIICTYKKLKSKKYKYKNKKFTVISFVVTKFFDIVNNLNLNDYLLVVTTSLNTNKNDFSLNKKFELISFS